MSSIDFLFVEDSINDAHLVERILKKENLSDNYKWLKDGSEVLKYFFDEENPTPKFILLDIKMPKVNGLEVLEKMKNHDKTKDIPIIIYSSSTENSDIASAYAHGVNSYINKPDRYQEMKELFISLFHYWLKFNRNADYGKAS